MFAGAACGVVGVRMLERHKAAQSHICKEWVHMREWGAAKHALADQHLKHIPVYKRGCASSVPTRVRVGSHFVIG